MTKEAKEARNDDAKVAAHEDELVAAALAARENAYAPYSKFYVGAALLTEDGEVVQGCNVENASYGLCICAERTAVTRAVAEGKRRYLAVAIATDTSPPSPPCGVCLQTLIEFSDDMPVWLVNPQGERMRFRLRTLMPVRFRKEVLQ